MRELMTYIWLIDSQGKEEFLDSFNVEDSSNGRTFLLKHIMTSIRTLGVEDISIEGTFSKNTTSELTFKTFDSDGDLISTFVVLVVEDHGESDHDVWNQYKLAKEGCPPFVTEFIEQEKGVESDLAEALFSLYSDLLMDSDLRETPDYAVDIYNWFAQDDHNISKFIQTYLNNH